MKRMRAVKRDFKEWKRFMNILGSFLRFQSAFVYREKPDSPSSLHIPFELLPHKRILGANIKGAI